MTQTGSRAALYLFGTAGVLCVAAVALTATTPGDGPNIGAGGLVLLAMLVGLIATVYTVSQQRDARADPRSGLGRRALLGVVVGSAVAAALAAAVGQWPLAGAALVPAAVAGYYALRDRAS